MASVALCHKIDVSGKKTKSRLAVQIVLDKQMHFLLFNEAVELRNALTKIISKGRAMRKGE